MRVQHLKKRADAELKAGNHRSASATYRCTQRCLHSSRATGPEAHSHACREALDCAVDRGERRALLANLALALTRGAPELAALCPAIGCCLGGAKAAMS